MDIMFYIWVSIMILVSWGVLTTFIDSASSYSNTRKQSAIVSAVIIIAILIYFCER